MHSHRVYRVRSVICARDLVWDGMTVSLETRGDGRSTLQAKPLMILRRFSGLFIALDATIQNEGVERPFVACVDG
jgi:hypothetical protein